MVHSMVRLRSFDLSRGRFPEPVDAVIWCTGFRPALRHLSGLQFRDHHGRVPANGRAGTQSTAEPRLFLVG